MSVVQIHLNQGHVALIDSEDLPLVEKHKWYAVESRPQRWYAMAKIDGKLVRMHRLLLGLNGRAEVADHVNGDGLNNTRANLRRCSPTQNLQNMSKRSGPTTSRFKGVAWDKARNRWCAGINAGGRRKALGRFDSEIEAARAYDAAAIAMFGEFARTNLPRGGER